MYDSTTEETSSLSTTLDVFEEASLDFKTQYGIVTVTAGTDTDLYIVQLLQVQILYLYSTVGTDTILVYIVQLLQVQILYLYIVQLL